MMNFSMVFTDYDNHTIDPTKDIMVHKQRVSLTSKFEVIPNNKSDR